ncbi:9-O-acetyl-N-acetylneuraminate esterase [Fusobacterium necrophorum subsp. funduliforme]|uniref:AAA family ATPase n=2 Tax=Fusobacterium necrophorum TaxID=859 RepID=UPI0007888363|nr:AAA family ATPase [Fusobacterium necrophorum]KYM39052.1 9-O-acetyl-N-acetylneuraminate esterase [Fusobacterium necrophorum subsp. funduliforme]KYM51447.1 9-O-acetyl-N-acetylneuraminate esterase [Fusobacterium necrophorum subsp. funduliforme]KYM59284.1 9-O-acetyl-N-acetylneuraminate esterase [Fusobacterium necrophorum subsp. funduliforme]MDK4493657.1 ATP-binding protein [Fusobacterium necrophorum]
MKLLPVGITDFREILESNYYYIDKTQWIEELFQDGAKVKLFTRPRRFGKTLNMSMLRYFFDIQNRENTRKLFQGLEIENSPYMAEQGKYPVIFLSFKDVKERNWRDCLRQIKILLKDLYNSFEFLRSSLNPSELRSFDKIWFEEESGNYQNALKMLSSFLKKYYQKKSIILIDEYDTSIVCAYEHGYYEEAISFFRNFYSSALKDNECLQLGVMTGILRVAKEGIFSGLNNLMVYGVFEEKYSSSFGLTEEEVKKALGYYGLAYNIEKVKEWYDGYRFGNMEIYNPWSILNYIFHQRLESYWVNTSNNFLIYDILERANRNLFEELQAVFQGKEIQKTLEYSFSFQDMTNPQEIWQLLVHSGYLKIEKNMGNHRYALKIPNREIYQFFERSFLNRFLGGVDYFQDMISALQKEDIKVFEKKLQEILLSNVSYHDVGQEEKYYHNFILGMILSLSKEYEIHSNLESGYGIYDISLEPKDKRKLGFILELKIAKSEEELEKRAKEALEQIEEKNYDVSMKQKGVSNILKLGLAFYGKRVLVLVPN